ncbi:hypothetical protein [Bradyrhizobium sp. 2TAF24]|uniref:hypothetical protein n=1 Tax=Bradyrhizobium sp. 2TAF24 TaxID=3233011 RepID=UPI003F902989
MARPEPQQARNSRADDHPAWDDADWSLHDEEASGARARRLLARRTGPMFDHADAWLHGLRRAVFGARWLRLVATVAGVFAIVAASGFGVLWWRLGTGPINLDVMTPWLVAAIEDNLGKDHTVEVGGTQIERTGRIRIAVRIRDIVVRDRAKAVVASAPKAEVRISPTALMLGRLRAESLNLVGAELSVRIAPDGRVIVSTGDNARPLATAAAPRLSPPPPAPTGPTSLPQPAPVQAGKPAASEGAARNGGVQGILAGLDWLDGLSKSGLDGENLDEVGLKNGNLIVDDQRTGGRLTFQNISLSLRRPRGGGVALSLGEDGKNAWFLKVLVGPQSSGVRSVDVQADKVPVKNILLALRLKELNFTADMPLTGRVRGEIGRDGLPTFLTGKMAMGAGQIIDRDAPDYPMDIDQVDINVDWDAARRVMVAPFQIVSGANRITLLAHLEPPNDSLPNWQLGFSGGTILFGGENGSDPLIFNRIAVRLRFDTDNRRVLLTQADFGNGDISIAGSGSLDYSTAEPRLTLGLAGTPMPVSALKRIWPIVVVPEVREWVVQRVDKGTLQRMEIGVNAPVHTLSRSGPPIPDDGLAITFVGSNVAMHPVDELPGLHDADLKARVTGRTATINVGQAAVDTPAGRRLTISDLVFDIPDFVPKPPPARVRFRVDGPVPAAAEILNSNRLSEFSSSAPIDPNTSRGNVTAQVMLGLPIKNELTKADTSYAINIDLTGFSADKLVMNQKLEGNALKVVANNQGYQVKGDVKIGGQAASLDYRKPTDGDADVKLQATLDDAGRAKLGVDLGTAISGAIPVKLTGRIGAPERENKLGIEADLTAARVDNLLPGWVKAAGKASRITFNVVQKPQATRLEDIAIDGSGVQIKGALEIDQNGDVINAAFPTFAPSEGDKTSLKAERAPDGVLKVTMRGDVFDARGFLKSAISGRDAETKTKQKAADLDLDLKMGAIAGFDGEAVRGVDVKLSRRAGVIKAFQLNGKIGRDTPLTGDIRGKAQGREVLYLETNDAGALFRFTDIYKKMVGGRVWLAMDPPASDASAQEGLLNVRDFSVKGEAALDRVVANGPATGSSGVGFSHMRAEFTRQSGQLTIRDGILRGPTVGATIEGNINYPANQVRMSGTFVPMYGLNNMFGQIPIVGLVLGGGSNEGLIGITYEVVGTPGAPVLRVNPISAMAPGVLRKIFEFGTGRQNVPSDNFPPPN